MRYASVYQPRRILSTGRSKISGWDLALVVCAMFELEAGRECWPPATSSCSGDGSAVESGAAARVPASISACARGLRGFARHPTEDLGRSGDRPSCRCGARLVAHTHWREPGSMLPTAGWRRAGPMRWRRSARAPSGALACSIAARSRCARRRDRRRARRRAAQARRARATGSRRAAPCAAGRRRPDSRMRARNRPLRRHRRDDTPVLHRQLGFGSARFKPCGSSARASAARRPAQKGAGHFEALSASARTRSQSSRPRHGSRRPRSWARAPSHAVRQWPCRRGGSSLRRSLPFRVASGSTQGPSEARQQRGRAGPRRRRRQRRASPRGSTRRERPHPRRRGGRVGTFLLDLVSEPRRGAHTASRGSPPARIAARATV